MYAPYAPIPQGPLTREQERMAVLNSLVRYGCLSFTELMREEIRRSWVDHNFRRRVVSLTDSSDLSNL